MKSFSYLVYVHFNQISGEVEYAKCPCKASQGGCCKHAPALLYTMLDFVNLNLKAIPTELTCTQLPQKWNVPSGSSKTLNNAVKFDHLLFEKADVNKKRKRCLVKGIREEYCATPPFAQTITEEEIERMSSAFREVNQASLFCKALESNNYKPFELFNTSCSKQKRQRLQGECTGNLEQTSEYVLVEEIF